MIAHKRSVLQAHKKRAKLLKCPSTVMKQTMKIARLFPLLILVSWVASPLPAVSAEGNVFDRITGFFSEQFKSEASQPPKDWALTACTEASRDAHEFMQKRQAGEPRSDVTRLALDRSQKQSWPASSGLSPDDLYMTIVADAYAEDRAFYFFREGVADDFRDDTFASCLIRFQ